MGPSLTTFKLLLMAAASSRESLRNACLATLRPFVRDGDIHVRYACEGRQCNVFIRMDDVLSDYYSVLELGVKHIYHLDRVFNPDLVIDGGGNIGLFSLSAAAIYPTSRIVICEPVPRNLKQIRKHMNANNVAAEILPVCLGGTHGKIQFYEREANQGSFDSAKPYFAVLNVDVWTLADVLRDREAERILIKLDIEGMEIETLEHYVPNESRAVCIVGELHDHKNNCDALRRIFARQGWSLDFEDVTDQGSAFEAYSPAATALLRTQPAGAAL